MLEIFLAQWPAATIAIIISYVFHRLAIWGAMESILAPIHLHAVTMSITIGMLVALRQAAVLEPQDFTVLFTFFFCAWVGLAAGNLATQVSMPLFDAKIDPYRIPYRELGILGAISALGLLAMTTLSLLLWLHGNSGDDRLVIQKQFRVIDIFRQAGMGMGIPCLWYVFLFDLRHSIRRIALITILLFAFVGIFSGSKSLALALAIPYTVLASLMPTYHRRSRFHRRLSLIAIFVSVAGLFAAFGIKAAITEDNSTPMILMADRIAATADAYDYAFRDNAIHNLSDHFSPGSYLMHPFLKLVGSSGYDYPLGVALFESRTGDSSGYGPNANLPLFGYIFLESSPWVFMATSGLILGLFIPFARSMSIRFLVSSKRNPVIAMFPICVFYLPCLMIYADIGLFTQQLLCNTLALLIGGLTAVVVFSITLLRRERQSRQ